jgi:PAS domain S-box-containing protein
MDDSPNGPRVPRAEGPVASASPNEGDLDLLFDLSLDLLCVAGLDGFFKRVNPAFSRVLGYRTEDLLSRAFVEFVHPDDQDATVAATEQLAHGQDVVDFENRYRAADGSWLWLEWRATSVPEQGLIFAVARDVTQQRRLEVLALQQADDLARSNADLEQFASMASHDLQAPLNAVHLLAGWIEEELPEDPPPKVIEHLAKLRERVRLMSDLVSDLLAYSRTGRAGDVELIDCGELVQTMVDLLGPPEGFEIVVAPDMPHFETVRTALEQALRNLIANALGHHDRDHGKIAVSAREDGEFWEFTVADDGPGIAPADRPKIFDLLWSAPAGTHRGAGMGLALVKRIVERYGGRVWLDETSESGAAFRFTWPKMIGE